MLKTKEQLLALQVSNEGIVEPQVLTGRDEEIQTRSEVARTAEGKEPGFEETG